MPHLSCSSIRLLSLLIDHSSKRICQVDDFIIVYSYGIAPIILVDPGDSEDQMGVCEQNKVYDFNLLYSYGITPIIIVDPGGSEDQMGVCEQRLQTKGFPHFLEDTLCGLKSLMIVPFFIVKVVGEGDPPILLDPPWPAVLSIIFIIT
ncbi:hypothetical protein Bpfe_006565 [Biomphalaria pfeifferi]|uniref:Uncharacterized protein n=1 Tax=Biomphalaria pfeifferi TaxID=112525 RepID=A0AAD8C0A6_BIOPF|nr:hypothetical protein Bpfe_006565 [Biomphalaria pfeifferi]